MYLLHSRLYGLAPVVWQLLVWLMFKVLLLLLNLSTSANTFATCAHRQSFFVCCLDRRLVLSASRNVLSYLIDSL